MTAAVKSVFNRDWMNPSLNPEFSVWIKEVPNNQFSAFCTLCKRNFSLSNMGKRAVTSHAESAKHKKFVQDMKSSSMLAFLSKDTSGIQKEKSTATLPSTSCASNETVSNYLVQQDVFKAEVIWAMKLVVSHSSFNSFTDASEIFSLMFTDSKIAQKCTLGRAKMAYLICYGLAPYFHLSLENSVNKKMYVVCFDEALNRISQKCQMDVIIRYWCDSTNRVACRYWTSVFLGRTTAEELFQNFKAAVSNLDINLLLQISMDGPNVNLKFLKHLKEELLSENGSDILDLGTCGLHIVHGAFQFGHKSTNWKLDAILRALYNLFKDSPARCANFIEATNSSEFPLKFCSIRWVENVCVSERAPKVFDNVKKYVEINKKSLPGTVTADTVISACQDKLTLGKISFFSYVANILQPFLKIFQTPKPMVPFLYSDLFSLATRQLMKIIIKSDLMEEAKSLESLFSIDVEDSKNLRHRKNIDLGIVTSRYVKISGASESQKIEFMNDCFSFVRNTVKKIFDRTSKNFAILRAVSSINPFLLQTNAVLCEKRMSTLLEILYSKGKISPSCAERAKLQFEIFVTRVKTDYKEHLTSFTEEMGLDVFYYELLQSKEFMDIWEVVQVVLILSHGNAAVESGFSVNKDMLVENLKEDSLIGLRPVYDAVKFHEGIANVQLTKDLLQYAKSARTRYHEALEKRKEMQEKDNEKEKNKQKVSQQIKILQKKKMKLIDDKSIEIAEIDGQIRELSKKSS